MLIQVLGGKEVEVDEKTAEILIKAGKAVIVENSEKPAEKKTRKKINND